MSTQEYMETWRLRTPNKWERAGHWADVFMWRNHIYAIVINAFKNVERMAPQLHSVGALHFRPHWFVGIGGPTEKGQPLWASFHKGGSCC